MMDRELKTNASGYYDEPCYRAMTARPKAGEIWVHATSGAYMLVLSNVGGVNTCLRLNETKRDDESIPVMARVQMWVNPSFLGYCFDTALSNFVKVAQKQDFDAAREAVVKLMGYDVGEDCEEEQDEDACEGGDEEELHSRCTELEAALAKAKHELLEANDRIDIMRDAVSKAKLEAEKVEFYREMYEKLLNMMLK